MLIGLTGGMGCGKSTANKIFGELGFNTLDCDQLIQEIYSTDAFVRASLLERFGQEVFTKEGTVDKNMLGHKVFSDKQELTWLENLVHPKVKELWEKYISRDPKSHWIVEIPLLFEKKLENEFDITICLSAKVDLQLSRLVQKGMSLENAKARIACQMPLEQKEKQANYVIDNNGNIDSLRSQIYSLVQVLNHQSL